MKAWVVVNINTHPVYICWTKQRALEVAGSFGGSGIVQIEIDPLEQAVEEYYAFRKYYDPSTLEAFLWLVSEIGELAGALVHQMKAKLWIRNNDHSKDSPEDEIADVTMMLIKLGQKLGIDPELGRRQCGC